MPTVIVDNAIYVDEHRTAEPGTLSETYEAVRERRGVAWIGLYRPTQGEFGPHEPAVEDATEAHQRPKLEHYGGTLFVVLKPARYLDEEERVEFGEIHVFVGEDFVVTVRHSEAPDVGDVRRGLEADPGLLSRGPEAIRYLHDVQDHVLQVTERLAGFRELLQSILSVNLTLSSLAQNEEVKKISAWAAILFAPTLVGTIYGMNFRYMPELNWLFGYPFALLLMGFISLTLYLVFKRRGWL